MLRLVVFTTIQRNLSCITLTFLSPEESNTLTTTTTTSTTSFQSERPSSDTTTELVSDSREQLQLGGKKISEKKHKGSAKKLHKGIGNDKVTVEVVEGKPGKECGDKDSSKDTATTTAAPQFKFAKPKTVSSKRENRGKS